MRLIREILGICGVLALLTFAVGSPLLLMRGQHFPSLGLFTFLLLPESLLVRVENEIILVLNNFLSVVSLAHPKIDSSEPTDSHNSGNISRANGNRCISCGDIGLAPTRLRDGKAFPSCLLRALFTRGALSLCASRGVDANFSCSTCFDALSHARFRT